MGKKKHTTYSIGPVSYLRMREAFRAWLNAETWRNYFHAGISDTFHAFAAEGADLDLLDGDIERLREEYKADVEKFAGVDCLRYKAIGMMRELWLGEADPYIWAWFILAPPKLGVGTHWFFGVEGKGINYHIYYARFAFIGATCTVEVRGVSPPVDITGLLPADYVTRTHIYQIETKPGRVKFWIDGTVVATIDTVRLTNCRSLAYVVQNSAVGHDGFIRLITVTSWNPKDFAIDLASGQKTVAVAGAQEALGADMEIISVSVKALRTNLGNVYVGDDTVSAATGHVLAPGESVDIEIDNLDKIWIDVDTAGEGVSYLVVKEWM